MDEFVSFIGTYMNLETIILNKLTQEPKTKHHMLSLIGMCWTIRTHGHTEGCITHCRQYGAKGGTEVVGRVGRDNEGRNTGYRWWGGRQQITLPCVYLCNNLACSSYVPHNLKSNKKRKSTSMQWNAIHQEKGVTYKAVQRHGWVKEASLGGERWLTRLTQYFEAGVGESPEVRSWRPAWSTWWNPVSTKNTKNEQQKKLAGCGGHL